MLLSVLEVPDRCSLGAGKRELQAEGWLWGHMGAGLLPSSASRRVRGKLPEPCPKRYGYCKPCNQI
jgi:hypothetical protein